jgi:hypothetical protein
MFSLGSMFKKALSKFGNGHYSSFSIMVVFSFDFILYALGRLICHVLWIKYKLKWCTSENSMSFFSFFWDCESQEVLLTRVLTLMSQNYYWWWANRNKIKKPLSAPTYSLIKITIGTSSLIWRGVLVVENGGYTVLQIGNCM